LAQEGIGCLEHDRRSLVRFFRACFLAKSPGLAEQIVPDHLELCLPEFANGFGRPLGGVVVISTLDLPSGGA
jgi:hypothetical protein